MVSSVRQKCAYRVLALQHMSSVFADHFHAALHHYHTQFNLLLSSSLLLFQAMDFVWYGSVNKFIFLAVRPSFLFKDEYDRCGNRKLGSTHSAVDGLSAEYATVSIPPCLSNQAHDMNVLKPTLGSSCS